MPCIMANIVKPKQLDISPAVVDAACRHRRHIFNWVSSCHVTTALQWGSRWGLQTAYLFTTGSARHTDCQNQFGWTDSWKYIGTALEYHIKLWQAVRYSYNLLHFARTKQLLSYTNWGCTLEIWGHIWWNDDINIQLHHYSGPFLVM